MQSGICSKFKSSENIIVFVCCRGRQLTLRALHPLLVLAIKQPSVVAIGTIYFLPSNNKGPADPIGTGI